MTVTPIIDRRIYVQAGDVHNVLGRHMLADGYEIVMDLRKSKGSWVFDSRRGRNVLDFFTNFASCPIGYNHPRLDNPEFRDKLAEVAINKPANSDIYTTYMAEFVETFARIALPPAFQKHAFFIEGGALGIENAVKTAFDWKIRKNLRKGLGEKGTQIMHLREAFHGRTGYTLSLTNTDPKKTMYFPKFDWPRIDNPKISFPATEESLRDAAQREAATIEQAKNFLHERKDDIAAFIMEPVQGEGGDNHFRPEFFRAVRQLCDENDMLLIFDEVQSGVGITGKMWAFQHYGVEPDLCLDRPHLRHRRQRLRRLVAHQLDLGRQPDRHGPLAALLRGDRRGEPGRQRRPRRRLLPRRAAALRRRLPESRLQRPRPRPHGRFRPPERRDPRRRPQRLHGTRRHGPLERQPVGPLPPAFEPLDGRGRGGDPQDGKRA